MYLTASLTGLAVLAGLAYSVANNGTDAKNAQPQEKLTSSKIFKVVAYPNSALVTREVDVPAGAGLVELVVAGLPNKVLANSLYSEGVNGVRVLSTRYRTRHVFEDTREEVRKIDDELRTLDVQAEKTKADAGALQQNLKMVDKLENFTDKTATTSTEKGGLNGDTVITMAKYVMEQRTKMAKELVALSQQQRDIAEKAAFLQKKRSEMTSGNSREEQDAVVVVDRDNGGPAKIKLNYLVGAVTWQPQYKFRAGKWKEPVDVDYLASLIQMSGEDWLGVDLTLSTAQPMLNAAPPELRKLEVTVIPHSKLPPGADGKGGPGGGFGGGGFNPNQKPGDLAKEAWNLRQEALQLQNSAKGYKDADKFLNEAAAAEQNYDLLKSKEEILAENRKGGKQQPQPIGLDDGPSVSFHLPHRISVPSRRDEQIVEMAKFKLEPKYYYKAVPVLTKNVYRLADVVNKSGHTLLPGEATIFQGTDFVGRMHLPLVAEGEEFTAGFGIDPQVQVTRQMMDKVRSTSGGNQVMKFEYRILVSNYKSNKVQLQVWDRLPIAAEAESASVALLKTSHELSDDAIYKRESRPNNLLRWDLELEPTMNGEKALVLTYEFRLELDKQMVINTFLSR
jgi:hypothetical protein